MSRPLSVIGYILLGALAAGIGTGFFLYKSNSDRASLVAASESARQRSEELAAASRKLADEANAKLDHASAEVRNAQELIKKYDEERVLLSKATPLSRTKLSANWKEWINIPLGYTLRLPVGTGNAGNERFFDFGWMKIEPYDADREALLRSQSSSTSEVVYFVDGHLLVGTRGQNWVIRDQIGASSTMLLWANPGSAQGEKTLLESLSSFTFRE